MRALKGPLTRTGYPDRSTDALPTSVADKNRRKAHSKGSSARKDAKPVAAAPGRPPTVGGRGGERLAAAFEAVESFPVLAEARARAVRAAKRRGAGPATLAPIVESDLGLTIVVLRAANVARGRRGIGSVPAAVGELGPEGVARAISAATAYDFLDTEGPWGAIPETMRRHAVATRTAVERVAELAGLPARDDLAAAAILHDLGRLVLLCLYGDYPALMADPTLSAEERLRIERRELGIDHALVGGVFARRLGAPSELAAAIERHHAADATGAAAAVGLADQIASHAHGEPISAEGARARAKTLGIKPAELRGLLYEFPYGRVERPHSTEPCPLSARELDALRGLASGKVYKEIAEEMELSASTVRTHLHNVYRKVGASDRAQAVLVARDRGWI
jgi:DNA-binding CsgD family transcriptional regulator/HD-like signal output (HDOD) protein